MPTARRFDHDTSAIRLGSEHCETLANPGSVGSSASNSNTAACAEPGCGPMAKCVVGETSGVWGLGGGVSPSNTTVGVASGTYCSPVANGSAATNPRRSSTKNTGVDDTMHIAADDAIF